MSVGIMDSYRPHSHASHRYRTFHMFVDELFLQLLSNYHTAIQHCEARAQQSDLLCMPGVGQHHPERSPATTVSNLCMVCCDKYNKYLKKHPATTYRNMPHKRRKTMFWCSPCHRYLCLRRADTGEREPTPHGFPRLPADSSRLLPELHHLVTDISVLPETSGIDPSSQ